MKISKNLDRLFFIPLFFLFYLSCGMEKEASDKKEYFRVKMHIRLLEVAANQKGDLDSGLAVRDFYANLKEPSCEITYDSSKNLLNKLNILDDNNNIKAEVREAFKKYGEC